MLEQAAQQWDQLADDADRAAEIGLTHPNVAKANARIYRRAAEALRIQQRTGIAVCSCCHKPLGDEKPYWMRGSSAPNQETLQMNTTSLREAMTPVKLPATPEWIADLIERETHCDTMRALSPLERQWLADWRAHFEPLCTQDTERT